MPVGRLLLIVLVLIPLVEIALLIKVGQSIGLFPTLAVLIGAGILGGWLLRWQGMTVLRDLRSTMGQGRLPGRALADTMLIGVAAVLLILPGLISDVIAIALLLPPLRSLIYALLARNMVVVQTGPSRHGQNAGGDPVIELDHDDYRPR